MAIFVRLRVSGDGLDFPALEEAFSGWDVHSCKKGGAFYDRFRDLEIPYTEDCFTADAEYPDADGADAALLDFAGRLAPHREMLRALAARHTVMVWGSFYPDGWHTDLALSPRTLLALAELGAELHLEVSCLKEIYEGNYDGKGR